MTTFDFEENRLKKEITRRKARRVLIQLPEGLKPDAPRLATEVEEAGALAIIAADPCYGACDLALSETHDLETDLLVHYGHAEKIMGKRTSIPVLYIEARSNVDVKSTVEKAVEELEQWTKIGLATTVQHIDLIKEAKEILEGHGKTVFVGHTRNMRHPGQVLGCDYSNAKSIMSKVEAFLFIGGGQFHAIGLLLATMKPTIVADPFERRAYSIDEEAQKTIKRRWSDISQAAEAKSFGIIIGLKTGQNNLETAMKIKEKLEKLGRQAFLLATREITPSIILQFPTLEAYVNTACPRIALFESVGFTKPVLTIREASVILGKTSWESLLTEGMI